MRKLISTSSRTRILVILIAVLTVSACGVTLPATSVPPTAVPPTPLLTTAIPATPVPATQPLPDTVNGGKVLSWLSVYFTNPNPPDQYAKGGVDQVVVRAMNNARQTIDLASFDFTLPSVADALVAAQRRGVKVRVIVDDKNGSQNLNQDDLVTRIGQPFEKVKAAGIPIIGGGRSNGLMHNKMILIDGSLLYMGSWNMSYNDTFRNNNNLLEITSQKLIENYQAKFNEGFERKLFGAKALLLSPNPKLSLNGVDVEQYFSPDDKVMSRLVGEVGKAQKSVKFMIFTYTHPDLSKAMITKFKAGLDVQGVIENRGATQGALVPLACASVPVRVDGNSYTMHHKVIIIDDATVVTGSFNFTDSADTANDDNVIIIRSKTVAGLYLQEYARISAQSKEPNRTGFTCPTT